MNWAVVEVAAPEVEPVSLEELRAHLNLTAAGSPATHPDDDLITAQGIAAREWVESYTGYAIIQRQLRLYLDAFPSDDTIILPRSRLVSIDSVQYVDTDGATQTWDAGNYSADTASAEGRLMRGYQVDWPTIREQRQAVTITYTAGFPGVGSPEGLTANVPKSIKAAIKLMVANMYEYREEMVAGTVTAEVKGNTTVKDLLAPYRRHYL